MKIFELNVLARVAEFGFTPFLYNARDISKDSCKHLKIQSFAIIVSGVKPFILARRPIGMICGGPGHTCHYLPW